MRVKPQKTRMKTLLMQTPFSNANFGLPKSKFWFARSKKNFPISKKNFAVSKKFFTLSKLPLYVNKKQVIKEG
jgi:hypothetical protein